MLFVCYLENERKSGGGSRLRNEIDTRIWDVEVVDLLERIFPTVYAQWVNFEHIFDNFFCISDALDLYVMIKVKHSWKQIYSEYEKERLVKNSNSNTWYWSSKSPEMYITIFVIKFFLSPF